MIERLVLVRHGDAEFFGPEGTDLSRRLTKKGAKALKREYPKIFSPLKDEKNVTFWVSPAQRAIETAEIAAEVLDIDPDEFSYHDSLYDQDDEDFLAELYAEGDGCIIAVGHIPFMNRFFWEITNQDISFGKGSVASIVFPEGDLMHGTLEWFEKGPHV